MQKIDYFPDRLIKDRITLLGVLRGRKWGLWGELGHWPMSLRTLSCSDPVLCSLLPWLMSLERQTALFGPTLLLPRSPAMDFEKTMEAMSQNTSSFCHNHDRSTETEGLSCALLVIYKSLQVLLVYAEAWVPLTYRSAGAEKRTVSELAYLKLCKHRKIFKT